MENQAFKTKAEIAATEAANHPEFGKLNLAYIREGVNNILKLIGRDGIFHEYTLHDMTHIDAMLELLNIIIPQETEKIMTPADWLLIVLACYFHDLGLLVTKKEYKDRKKSKFPEFREEVLLKGDTGIDYKASLSHLEKDETERFYYQEFVRYNHAERIFHWINGHAKEELGATHQAVNSINTLLDGLNEKLRRDLALICRSHHRDDLDQIETVYVLRRAYGQPPQTHANLQYSALLLRTADLLQIQRNRAPAIMYRLIDPANPKSQDEWAKQATVRAVLPTKSKPNDDQPYDTIEVQAEFDEASGFFGLIAYLHYAQKEIKQSAEWANQAKAKDSKYDFPWRYIDDNQVETIGFLPQRYQFTLDREKILNLLTGHTLYNDTSVAIREILQNAIDAVRFHNFIHQNEELGEVKVKWNTKTRRLVIEDNGIGMTRATVENHLLNVGASYYQERKFKDKYPDFSPISRFGIGVLSYFMISNDIEILTVNPEEEMAHQLTLPSATQRYLIKLLAKDHPDVKSLGPHGTRVSLVVRVSAKLDDIEKILRYWIVLPKCPVSLVVDDKESKEIGFSRTDQALEFYVKQSLTNVETMKFIKTKRPEPRDGLDLAYAINFSRWFKVWGILCRNVNTFNRKFKDAFSKPPGICVEGIRISANPPGYGWDGVWALANLTGSNAPRTNVARSDLEDTEELKVTNRKVYQILGNHICEEFQRLINSGAGLTKASLEADFMTDRLKQGALNQENAEKCIDSLPIFTIEDLSERKSVSRNELRHFDSIWTFDGPMIRHIDGLTESLKTKLSAADIIRNVTGQKKPSIPMPRVIGRRTSALIDFEVSSISIDTTNISIILEWKLKENRWLVFTRRDLTSIGRRSPVSFDEDRIVPYRSGVRAIAIAVGVIQCNNPAVCNVRVRGFDFHLVKSPVTLLWNTFKGSDYCWPWIASLISTRRIAEREMPKLREDLRATGAEPDEIIPKLKIQEDMIFDLRPFTRNIYDEYFG